MYDRPILLLGGGLDSVATLIILSNAGIEFDAMLVNYGQVAFRAEKNASIFWCSKLGVTLCIRTDFSIEALNPQPNILFGTSETDYQLNARNLVLILQALPKTNHIMLGLTGKQSMADTSQAFMDSVSELLTKTMVTRGPITVSAPLMDIIPNCTKALAVKKALELEPDFFEHTMTCWNPDFKDGSYRRCLKCKHCIEQQELEEELQNA